MSDEVCRAAGSDERVVVRLTRDVAAEAPDEGLEAGIATIDVVGPADGRHPVGDQARHDERGPGPTNIYGGYTQ